MSQISTKEITKIVNISSLSVLLTINPLLINTFTGNKIFDTPIIKKETI